MTGRLRIQPPPGLLATASWLLLAMAVWPCAPRGGEAADGYSRGVRDAEIRSALHARLLREHGSGQGTRYVDELGLCGTVRVDVAVVNGTLSGYELKSDRDTLRRLPMQVEYYSKVLDHATLVVGEEHYERTNGVAHLPLWWGIIVASPSLGEALLEDVRAAEMNENLDPYAIAQLLWRDEALCELEARDAAGGLRSKPRSLLWDRLAEVLELDELRSVVRERLKARATWRQPPPHE